MVAEIKEAVADEGGDFIGFEVDLADGGGFGVGEIEDLVFGIEGEAGGLGEIGECGRWHR